MKIRRPAPHGHIRGKGVRTSTPFLSERPDSETCRLPGKRCVNDNEIELLGAVSEPVYQRELAKLSRVAAKLRTGKHVPPRKAEELPERQPILDAVTAVMMRWNQPMRATEVLRAVEQQLGRPVSGSSVRNCLVDCRPSARSQGSV